MGEKSYIGLKPLMIIPARGGSKGIPRKNIKPLAGRPLLAYTAEAARKAADMLDNASESWDTSICNIILSTDDDEILAVGASLELNTDYRRPARLGGDNVGSREVILDVMDWADAQGIEYNCVVLLQPTSPLRTAEDILGALRRYQEAGDADMVVSVCPASCNPYYDCFEEDANTGILHVSKGDGRITRRQDAPKAWQYNGAVYVMRPESLRRYALGEMPRRIPYVMPAERSLDLDTMLDWQIADVIIQSGERRVQSGERRTESGERRDKIVFEKYGGK